MEPMFRPVMTRTERRVEKKNTVFVLVLILAVALVSFALGVMIGRGSARKDVTQGAAPVEAPRIPVAKDPPVAEPVVKPIAPAAPAVAEPVAAPAPNPPLPPAPSTASQPATKVEHKEAVADAAQAQEPAAKLSFYEGLPKGEKAPLGSGINRPPEPPKKAVAAPAPAATASKVKAQTAPATATASASVPPPATKPAAAAGDAATAAKSGAYVLQVASFARADEAGVLQAKLEKKGYPCYVQQADLGDKGTWYRVYAGPYGSSEDATTAALGLKQSDGLAPMVKKR